VSEWLRRAGAGRLLIAGGTTISEVPLPLSRRSREWLRTSMLECSLCHQIVERRSPVQRYCPDCRLRLKRARGREAVARARRGQKRARSSNSPTFSWPRTGGPAVESTGACPWTRAPGEVRPVAKEGLQPTSDLSVKARLCRSQPLRTHRSRRWRNELELREVGALARRVAGQQPVAASQS